MEDFSESYIKLATNCHILEQEVIQLEDQISIRDAKLNIENERYQLLDYFTDNKLKEPHQIMDFIVDFLSKYYQILDKFGIMCSIKIRNTWIVINSSDPAISLLSNGDQFESSFARVPIGFNMNILNWVNPELFQLSDKSKLVCANQAIKINSNILWTFWGEIFHERFSQYIEVAFDLFQTASKILWKIMENKYEEIRLLEESRISNIYHTLCDSLSTTLSNGLASQIWSEIPKIFDMLVPHSSCDIYLINPNRNIIYSAKTKQIKILTPSLLLHTIEKRCTILHQDVSKETINISIDYSNENDVTFHSILLVPLWLIEPDHNKALPSYPYSAVIIIKRIMTCFDEEELHIISEFLLKSTNVLLRWITCYDEAIIENKMLSSTAITRPSGYPSHCLSSTMNEVLQHGLSGLFRIDFLSIMSLSLRTSWICLLQKTSTGYKLFTEDGVLHFLPVDTSNSNNTIVKKFNNLFDFFYVTFSSGHKSNENIDDIDLPDDSDSRQAINVVNNYQLNSESVDVEIMQLITCGRLPFSPSINMLGWTIDTHDKTNTEKIMIFAGRTWLPIDPLASESILQSLNSHINYLLESSMKDGVLLLAEDLHIKISHLKSTANQSKSDFERFNTFLNRFETLRVEVLPPLIFRQQLVHTLNAFAKDMINGDISLITSETSTGISWTLTVDGIWTPMTEKDSISSNQRDSPEAFMTMKSRRKNQSTSDLFNTTPNTNDDTFSTVLFHTPSTKIPLATPDENYHSASKSEIRSEREYADAETLRFFMFQKTFRDTSINTSLLFTGINSNSKNDISQFITKLIPVVRSVLLERKSDLFNKSKEEWDKGVLDDADSKIITNADAGVDVAGAVQLANSLAIQCHYSNDNRSMSNYLTATSLLSIMKQYCGVELVTVNQPLELLIYRSYDGSIIEIGNNDQSTCPVNKKTREILSSFSLCRADGKLRLIQEYAKDILQDHNSNRINNSHIIDSKYYPFSYCITTRRLVCTDTSTNDNVTQEQEEYFHFLLFLSISRPLSADFLKYFEHTVSLSLLPLILTQPMYDEKNIILKSIRKCYRYLTSFITTTATTTTTTSSADDHLKLQEDIGMNEIDTERILKDVVQHCIDITSSKATCSYILNNTEIGVSRNPDTSRRSNTYKIFHVSSIDSDQLSFPNDLSENDELLGHSSQSTNKSTKKTVPHSIEISKVDNFSQWQYSQTYRVSFFIKIQPYDDGHPLSSQPKSSLKRTQKNQQLLAVVFLGDPNTLKIGTLYESLNLLWEISVTALNSMKKITIFNQFQTEQSTKLLTDITTQHHHTLNIIFNQVKQLYKLALPLSSDNQYSKKINPLFKNDNQKESVEDHHHLLIEIRNMLESTAKMISESMHTNNNLSIQAEQDIVTKDELRLRLENTEKIMKEFIAGISRSTGKITGLWESDDHIESIYDNDVREQLIIVCAFHCKAIRNMVVLMSDLGYHEEASEVLRQTALTILHPSRSMSSTSLSCFCSDITIIWNIPQMYFCNSPLVGSYNEEILTKIKQSKQSLIVQETIGTTLITNTYIPVITSSISTEKGHSKKSHQINNNGNVTAILQFRRETAIQIPTDQNTSRLSSQEAQPMNAEKMMQRCLHALARVMASQLTVSVASSATRCIPSILSLPQVEELMQTLQGSGRGNIVFRLLSLLLDIGIDENGLDQNLRKTTNQIINKPDIEYTQSWRVIISLAIATALRSYCSVVVPGTSATYIGLIANWSEGSPRISDETVTITSITDMPLDQPFLCNSLLNKAAATDIVSEEIESTDVKSLFIFPFTLLSDENKTKEMTQQSEYISNSGNEIETTLDPHRSPYTNYLVIELDRRITDTDIATVKSIVEIACLVKAAQITKNELLKNQLKVTKLTKRVSNQSTHNDISEKHNYVQQLLMHLYKETGKRTEEATIISLITETISQLTSAKITSVLRTNSNLSGNILAGSQASTMFQSVEEMAAFCVFNNAVLHSEKGFPPSNLACSVIPVLALGHRIISLHLSFDDLDKWKYFSWSTDDPNSSINGSDRVTSTSISIEQQFVRDVAKLLKSWIQRQCQKQLFDLQGRLNRADSRICERMAAGIKVLTNQYSVNSYIASEGDLALLLWNAFRCFSRHLNLFAKFHWRDNENIWLTVQDSNSNSNSSLAESKSGGVPLKKLFTQQSSIPQEIVNKLSTTVTVVSIISTGGGGNVDGSEASNTPTRVLELNVEILRWSVTYTDTIRDEESEYLLITEFTKSSSFILFRQSIVNWLYSMQLSTKMFDKLDATSSKLDGSALVIIKRQEELNTIKKKLKQEVKEKLRYSKFFSAITELCKTIHDDHDEHYNKYLMHIIQCALEILLELPNFNGSFSVDCVELIEADLPNEESKKLSLEEIIGSAKISSNNRIDDKLSRTESHLYSYPFYCHVGFIKVNLNVSTIHPLHENERNLLDSFTKVIGWRVYEGVNLRRITEVVEFTSHIK